MVSKEFVIQNEIGLHARPAALFVREASRFQSDVIIVKGDKKANGKSLLGILSLAITKGTQFELHITGVDEDVALAALTDLLEKGL